MTWGPNDANTKTIAVTLLGAALYEGTVNETFATKLSGVTGGAVLGASTATVAIVDDDPAPQLSFAVSKVKVNERDASVTLSVTRTGASGLIHSVDFSTRDGSARAGKDYAATVGTLTWLATDPDTKTITIPIIFKPRREDNENFKVELSNASGGAAIGLAECKVVITEKPRNWRALHRLDSRPGMHAYPAVCIFLINVRACLNHSGSSFPLPVSVGG